MRHEIARDTVRKSPSPSVHPRCPSLAGEVARVTSGPSTSHVSPYRAGLISHTRASCRGERVPEGDKMEKEPRRAHTSTRSAGGGIPVPRTGFRRSRPKRFCPMHTSGIWFVYPWEHARRRVIRIFEVNADERSWHRSNRFRRRVADPGILRHLVSSSLSFPTANTRDILRFAAALVFILMKIILVFTRTKKLGD